MGPERIREQYGIEAVPLLWFQRYESRSSGLTASALKVLGKGADAWRVASWVRQHDSVIVPGMGVLEASLPLRPWGVPYSMFLLSASGRLFGTKVALVSVGANVINQRATRWLFDTAARLAFYRSYRDEGSLDAMRQRGLDTTHDHVYPDLVFGIPAPPYDPGDPLTVGVGVMTYSGTNDHRSQADEIYATYIADIKRFIRWLVDSGRKIRLLVGDKTDARAVQDIMADLQEYRSDLKPGWIVAEPVTSFAELTQAIAPVSVMVATRYHNVMCALKLSKPTISIGYARKNIALMTEMGLGDFCQYAHSLDVDRLIEQFTELERRSAELRTTIEERNQANKQLLDAQFTALSSLLFQESTHVRGAAPAREAGEVPGEPTTGLRRVL